MSASYQAIVSAPFGGVGVRFEQGVLTHLELMAGNVSPIIPTDSAYRHVCDCISAYLEDASFPLSMQAEAGGTVFQQRVWRALREIPLGHTLTYSALAEQVGSGPRAVANACGANPLPLLVPCHRVVAARGIGGFMQGRDAGALHIKQWLLEHERRNPAAAG